LWEHLLCEGLTIDTLEVGKETIKERLHFTLSLFDRAAR
jgi:hypothetical protein